MNRAARATVVAACIAALTLLLLALGLVIGSTGLEPLRAGSGDPVAWQIVWDIRLPRTLGAWLAGMLLGLGGALAQGLFRNPLADPYLLGSASGASLGVALLLTLLGIAPAAGTLGARLGMTGAAFVGAVLLLVSVVRERWLERPHDRYRGVQK